MNICRVAQLNKIAHLVDTVVNRGNVSVILKNRKVTKTSEALAQALKQLTKNC